MDHRVSITQLDEETYLKLDHRKKLHSHDFGLKWFEILWMWWTIFLPYGCLFCGFSFFVFSSDFVGFLWLRRQKSNFFKLDLRSTQIPLRFTKRSKIGLGTVFENHRKSLIQHCGQTVLPNGSILMGQTLMENDKIEKFKWDILGNFQTLCFVNCLFFFYLSR